MDLTPENVAKIATDCLYTDEELADYKATNEIPGDAVIVQGVVRTYAFHPSRLESHREDVCALLRQLSDKFFEGRGDGWSFLNLPFKKDEETQWGEQIDGEVLLCLAFGLDLGMFPMPRELWAILPGSVPYVVFKKEVFDESPRPS